MFLEAVVLVFHIATTGGRPEGDPRSGPHCWCLVGSWWLAELDSSLPALVFGAPGSWCPVELWLLAPRPEVRGPVFWFHSGTTELPRLASLSPPMAWTLLKSEGFRILGSNSFCSLVLLGMLWNSLSFLRNGCYSHNLSEHHDTCTLMHT